METNICVCDREKENQHQKEGNKSSWVLIADIQTDKGQMLKLWIKREQ